MRLDEMVFEVQGPKIVPKDIDAAERQLGVKLPKDYRDFLLMYNGGESKYCESESPYATMKWWYSICDSEKKPVCSLVKANAIIKPTEFKDDYIAIGENIIHWYVLMKVRGRCRYGIGAWSPEEDIGEALLDFSSFSDLLSHLTHKDEP